MNKAHLTLIIFSVIPTVMTTNICQAKLQDEETQEFILVAEDSKGIGKRDNASLSDYITLKNVAKVTVVLAAAGATGGAGANLALQAVGATAVPTIGTCVVVGAGTGAGLAFGGGVAAMALKAVLAD